MPIRTLVLYSVKRRSRTGATSSMLSRDIKNLVGRAGRAGVTTRGLVICADENQWSLIEPVAKQEPGEDVRGALYAFISELRAELILTGLPLTNVDMEAAPSYHNMIDGIDSTLVDLVSEELGEEELVRIARDLSTRTFAAQQAVTRPDYLVLISDVFALRAQRIAGIQAAGRLDWIRETGTRARVLDLAQASLFPLRDRWDDVTSPLDPQFIDALLSWVWGHREAQLALSEVFQNEVPASATLSQFVINWVQGMPLVGIASALSLQIDDVLAAHAKVITFTVQVLVEQGIAILQKLVEAGGGTVAEAVTSFPEHLRFGVPTTVSRHLAAKGVRHRRAAVVLGEAPELTDVDSIDAERAVEIARTLISDEARWIPLLGRLVYNNTVKDLAPRGVEEP